MKGDLTAALARAEDFGYLNAVSTIPRYENPYVESDMFDEATAQRFADAWWKGWDRGEADLESRGQPRG